MINEAVRYASGCFAWLVEQVDKLFSAMPGAMDLVIGIFAIYVSIRMLLRPLFGGSDGVIGTMKKNKHAVTRNKAVRAANKNGG